MIYNHLRIRNRYRLTRARNIVNLRNRTKMCNVNNSDRNQPMTSDVEV